MLYDSLHIQSWHEKGKAVDYEWITFSVNVTDWVVQAKAAENRWQDDRGKTHSQAPLSPYPRAAWSVVSEELRGREFSSGQVSRIEWKLFLRKDLLGLSECSEWKEPLAKGWELWWQQKKIKPRERRIKCSKILTWKEQRNRRHKRGWNWLVWLTA